ncbi:MAG: hypothetical protein AAGI15_15045 [Pseudomonadota bacterium]
MTNPTRERVKTHFPAVLLTLLSIVQAIALELLWGHITDSEVLYTATFESFIAWTQVLATLSVVVLIWVVYASNVMRFRWVPELTDSIYPFMVGITEFWLVASLQSGREGQWFIVSGLIFALMTWISQITMRRARLDPDNEHFFRDVPRATLADFYPTFVIVILFLGVGTLVALLEPGTVAYGGAVVLALCFLCWQFGRNAQFWKAAIAETPAILNSTDQSNS